MAAASGSVIEGECEAVAEVEERPKGKVADGDRNGGALHVASAPLEGTKEHMEVVERHLDALTFCGSAINDLELQLSNAKSLYRRTYAECKVHLEETRRRLGACIPKSQPFIEVWRRARQVQEESNKAAARFDKASSQYSAAKEMIRVTERELENTLTQSNPSDGSNNHALLEVLNHATKKIVETEREKRDSETEHRRVLDRCNAVLEEYRAIERKLRPHIVKSRPYYEERWQSSQRLNELKSRITTLEGELRRTKQRYSDTLRHLDQLNHSLHRQRRANSLTPTPPGGEVAGGLAVDGHSDSESVQSWQVGEGVQFTGSTGSLPSIGSSVASDTSETRPQTPPTNHQPPPGPAPVIYVVDDNDITQLARQLVHDTLSSALARLRQ